MGGRLSLEVASPLHIGGGDQALLDGGELVEDGDFAYVVDIDSYFQENMDEIDEFVGFIESGGSVSSYFDMEEVKRFTKYRLEKRSYVNVRGDVHGFIKNGYGEPYIPGSSIKGFIRTALAIWVVKTTSERSWLNNNNKSSYAHSDLEKFIFRVGVNDPKYDLMKCVSIEDAEINGDNDLYIDSLKTFSLKKNGELKPKPWETHAELLSPGTSVETNIRVDTDLLVKMIEQGDSDAEEKARMVFGDGFERERNVVDNLKDTLSFVSRDILDKDEELITDGTQFKNIREFNEELRGRLQSGFAMRLGFNKGWHSNTVGSALSSEEIHRLGSKYRLDVKSRHENCGGNVDIDTKNNKKYFCHKCKTGNLDFEDIDAVSYPKTRVFAGQGTQPMYPLGWLINN